MKQKQKTETVRIVITVSKEEFDNFCEHKADKAKTGQFLGYRALEKDGLLKKIKK